MKEAFPVIIAAFCFVAWAHADEIILANGAKYEGNILDVDKGLGILKLDTVLDGELIGLVLEFEKEDMIYINKDDKYKDLVKKEVSEEERKSYLKRIKEKNDEIDMRYEDKRRFDRGLEHEKEMETLKHENRKDLIEKARREGVDPDVGVYVIDAP